MRFIDLSGQRFGNWVVLHRDKLPRQGNTYWRCRCDCGSMKSISGQTLKNGISKSCGCKTKELIGDANRKHGLKNSHIYIIWTNMKQRCFNRRTDRYANYGGRGITVCDKWKMDFMTFYNWANENGYKNGLSIDRIDVNGNYCPENCRWVELADQSLNKTDTRFIEYRGIKKTINEWSKELGLTRSAMVHRLDRNWPMDRIVSTPLKKIKEVTL